MMNMICDIILVQYSEYTSVMWKPEASRTHMHAVNGRYSKVHLKATVLQHIAFFVFSLRPTFNQGWEQGKP